MKFNTREDIEAPITAVWQSLTDFDHWERAALRRGAEVSRTDKMKTLAAGLSWHLRFAYRGKPRRVDVQLTGVDAPNMLSFNGMGQLLEGSLQLDLVELGARRTRVAISFEVLPRTLAARLFLQSLRLARGRMEKRFKARTAALAMMIEERHATPRKL